MTAIPFEISLTSSESISSWNLSIMKRKVKMQSHFSPPCGGRNSFGIAPRSSQDSLSPPGALALFQPRVNLPLPVLINCALSSLSSFSICVLWNNFCRFRLVFLAAIFTSFGGSLVMAGRYHRESENWVEPNSKRLGLRQDITGVATEGNWKSFVNIVSSLALHS